MPFAGGEARQVTDNGGYVAFESWDGKTLYYTKAALYTGPLFARPLAGGPERQILDGIVNRAFSPVEDGIYYVGPGEKPQPAPTGVLRFYAFASGRSRKLADIDKTVGQGLAVSPDRKTILFVAGEPGNADLMLIENFR